MGGRGGGQQQHGHKEWSSHKHALRMRTQTHRAKTQPARTAPRDKTTGATRAFSLTCGGCPGARQRQDSGPGGEGRQAANGQGSRATHNHARQRGDGRACWWGANTLRGTARYPRNTQDGGGGEGDHSTVGSNTSPDTICWGATSPHQCKQPNGKHFGTGKHGLPHMSPRSPAPAPPPPPGPPKKHDDRRCAKHTEKPATSTPGSTGYGRGGRAHRAGGRGRRGGTLPK
jgi:hypothetical protein